MSVFPIEVLESIIDFLAYDRRTLTTCALVSRAWVPRSRHHFFRHLELVFRSNDDHCRTFMNICSSNLSTIPGSGPKKISLLSSTNILADPPRIIREFMIWLGTTTNSQAVTMSEALFRSANEMDIRSMTSTFWPLLLDLPHRCFMGVKKLALSQAIFDSPDPFITLIALLPSLEQLELNFVVFRSGNTESKGISQPKKLRKLKLIMGAAGDILWLFQPCKTIEEFVAEVNKEQALSYVNSFLASSLAVKNGTLAHCTLRPNIPRSQRDLRKEIDFFLDPGPHFTIEGELSNLLVIFNNFGPRSPSHSPSKLTRIILHDVNAAVYRGRNRLHVFPSFDGWLAKDAFFQSLEEVWLQVSETFRKEVLIMAGWNESAMTVDEGSIPHVVMQDRIREVEELLPRCKRRGILKIKAVYMTGSF